MAIRFERLGSHDRRSFSSGQAELDRWFREHASQDERRNLTRVFVAVDDEFGIAGFYSLSSLSLGHADLPEDLVRRLPRYDAVPAVLIERLARDARFRGRRIGELLLADAVRRVVTTSLSLGVYAIAVDAKDDYAADFYEQHGFQRFPADPMRLFLLMSWARKSVETA